MKKGLLSKAAASAAAAAVCAAMLSGCGAQGAASTKGLDASLEYATAQVKKYVDTQNIRSSEFSDKAFFAAEAASMLVNDKSSKEELQKAARVLSLDTIVIADAEGKVVNAFPEEYQGKKLKETDYAYFSRIIKNISVKDMTDPELKDGEYLVKSGVKDEKSGGVIAVGFTSDDYGKITGASLAQDSGVNTVIFNDGAVLSSTLDGVSAGETAEEAGIKDDDFDKESFTLSAGDKKYICKTASADDFKVLCAQPE